MAGAVMTIHPIGGARGKDADEFVELPSRVYSGHNQWVPFLVPEIRGALDRTSAFFSHSEGAFFLARRAGNAVGRIAVLENRRLNEFRHRRDATFYFFESFDDTDVSRSLFEAACDWARSRGLTHLKGPQGFSAMNGKGIQIQGFDHRASMTMMCYHPPYYQTLVEDFGLTKLKDFYSARLRADTFVMPERIDRLVRGILRRGRFVVPEIRTRAQLLKYVPGIGEVYNRAFIDNHPDSVPLSQTEFRSLSRELAAVTEPELVRVVLYDNRVAGFLLGFPDLSSALQRWKGRVHPLSIVALMRQKRRSRRLIINGAGILPEYQGLGGNALLYWLLEQSVRGRWSHRRFVDAEMLQIAETTSSMLADAQTLGGEIHKTHRVYVLDL